MALNLLTAFVGRITAATLQYPGGSSKNETSSGAGDGTPYNLTRANDVFGFQQWILKLAGITPSANPDNALVSDYGDGLSFLAAAADKASWPTIAVNGTDPNKDIDFNPGSILSIAGRKPITLGSQLVKQLDAAWVVGNNVGGLFSGSVAASTTYHCFLIVKDSDLTIDAGFDTDPGAANIPAGYTAFRRIGSVFTDVSSNIVSFNQFGDYFELDVRINNLSSASGATSGAPLSLSVPVGLSNIKAKIATLLISASITSAWVRSTLSSNVAPTSLTADLHTIAGTEVATNTFEVPVDSSGQVRYRNDTITGGSIRIITDGWTDPRID